MSESQAPSVITRFAPSPTGNLHVGSARTALFNYLFAKKHGGKFLLRIEDTDKERSKKEFEEDILSGLSWLGILYDGVPVRQSERTDIYRNYLHSMTESGAAYEAEENQEKTGKVIRFKNPNKIITFHDLIRGDISFDTTELGDFVIAKDKETPLYHLAVVADDHEMNVTHVIRGEDHISNTPRQILIGRAIGAHAPLVYAHLPLILATDRSKLSKRNGAISVNEYRKEGYLPEALINFLALLGWNPGTDKEFFSLDELIKEFTLEKIQKGSAVFNKEKLDWFNREYLKHVSKEKLLSIVKEIFGNLEDEVLLRAVPVIFERVSTTGELKRLVETGEFVYFFKTPIIEAARLPWKDTSPKETAALLSESANILAGVEFYSPDTIKKAMGSFAEEKGKGMVFSPLRIALSGKDKSVDPFTIAYVIGKEETLSRINYAASLLT